MRAMWLVGLSVVVRALGSVAETAAATAEESAVMPRAGWALDRLHGDGDGGLGADLGGGVHDGDCADDTSSPGDLNLAVHCPGQRLILVGAARRRLTPHGGADELGVAAGRGCPPALVVEAAHLPRASGGCEKTSVYFFPNFWRCSVGRSSS